MTAGAGPSAVRDSDRLARVALNALAEPGDLRFARLFGQIGPERLYGLLLADKDLEGARSQAAARLRGLEPERILEQAERLGIRFVVPGDGEWPAGLDDLDHVEPLNQMAGAPLGLWVKGEVDLGDVLAGSVAVVGSRSATTYGAQVAGDLSAHLAGHSTTIVSGAAYGIDQAAHRGALAARGATVAVLACGVDRAYPAGHKALLDYIARTGALVSDLRPGCAPSRHRFLARNRLIAAMTRGTVVVEAAVRSGALNTASWAQRMQRTVMGVPGPVTSAPSEGVHELLRTGAASLVTRGEHVRELLAPVGEQTWTPPRGPDTPLDLLDDIDRRIVDALPVARPASAGSIARTAGTSRDDTDAALGRLASLGWTTEVEGGWRLTRAKPA